MGKRTIDAAEAAEKHFRDDTLLKLDRVLQWKPGSAKTIYDGGEPTELEPARTEASPVEVIHTDAYGGYALNLYAVLRQDGDDAFLTAREDLAEQLYAENEPDVAAYIMRQVVRRVNTMVAGSAHTSREQAPERRAE